MNLLNTAVACGVAVMLVTSASAGGMKRIKKEKDFLALVLGKKLVVNTGWAVIKADGTTNGKFTTGKWVGAWKWSKGYYCSAGHLGGKERPTDCFLAKSDGSILQLTSNKGKGKDKRVVDWRIE